MADFKITPPSPFIVEGAEGDIYELPRVRDLSAEQFAAMDDFNKAEGTAERMRACRKFVLTLCPELEKEPITDMWCMELMGALGKDSGLKEGES
jgi:hypothetical protein